MHRTLHGNSGTGILPVRPEPQKQSAHTPSTLADEPQTEKKSTPAKSKKSVHRASENQTAIGDNISANPRFIGLTAPATPPPAPTPGESTAVHQGASDADDSITPISAEATNTVVTNADPNTPEIDDSTAKPISAGMEAQPTESAAPPTQVATTLPNDIVKNLAASAAEVVADAAEPAVSEDSNPPTDQFAEGKTTAEKGVVSSANPRGTSAAKQDMTMKKAEKMQKVAGSGEQDLPGNPATGSEELPKGQKISEKGAAHGEKMDSTAMELPTRVSTSVNPPSETITSAGVAPTPALDARVLERTHDIVALHAMRLTDTGAESLHVVVKPGNGIQISLELRQSARGIEVSASLHKGDYDQLTQHWPDLQERLEARGVRVSSLNPPENYTGSSHHFHQSKQQSPQQESLHAGAFAEFALAGSMTEAPAARAARASAYRGWETWA